MRIGVMLRHYEQHHGGVKIYTENLLPRLLRADAKHRYVLLYQNPALRGTYAGSPHVEEVAIPVPGTVPWDQMAAAWAAKQYALDLLVNLKFTVPLLCRAKTIFIMHGSEWFTIPEAFRWHDRLYHKMFVRLYCRRADAIVTVSRKVKHDLVAFTGTPPDKIVPIYNGFDPRVFCQRQDPELAEEVRRRYQLPEKFILWVGQIYPPKNVERLLQAFKLIAPDIPHHLVLAGERRWRSKEVWRLIESLGLQDRIRFTDWVPHEDLAVFYNLADLFVLPSLYEGFGIPLLEAMACGCPVVTSETGSPPEVVGDAAQLVNPYDISAIAHGIAMVLSDPALRATMIARGLARARLFSWERCAAEMLALFDAVHAGGRPARVLPVPAAD
jgi:glycosyltransferase involved in cell wall biosynthesis